MIGAHGGVDPGTEGGIAVLDAAGLPMYVRPFHGDMTEDETTDIIRTAADLLKLHGQRGCYFEKVQYIGKRPGHEKGDGGKGSFTFGNANGYLRGSLRMAGVRPVDVYPMMWQARLDCMTAGNKNISKRRAIELFPSVPKITHNLADALLIARYGWLRSVAAEL